MGLTGERYAEPEVEVDVETFDLSRRAVTVREYEVFSRATDRPQRSECDPAWKGLDDPVTCVSWHDGIAYAEWLSRLARRHYSLPTEAQWEFAAKTRPSGLEDMVGRGAWEWLQDCWQEDHRSRQDDGTARCTDADVGVYRPGLHHPQRADLWTPASRRAKARSEFGVYMGFRVARRVGEDDED